MSATAMRQLFTSLEQAAAGMAPGPGQHRTAGRPRCAESLAWQLSGSLTEVGKAAAAVRRLAGYLGRTSNTLLFGGSRP